MKKVLLSLLAVAALVLSCQNYDDEFAALNSKVASLESQISSLAGLQTTLASVQSSVSALQAAVSAIPNLSSEVAAILADLEALATASTSTSADLDALKAELNTSLAALQALIEANSASIANLVASNSELKDALEQLGVDVDSVLAANATFEGNLTITNAAELAYAKSLGIKVATIKGDVFVNVDETDHTGGGDGTGLTAADVNSVLSQITYVVGNVKINTDASLDLSSLTSVTGDYIVLGHDVSDDALISVGDDVVLNYDGAYKSNLQTADNIYLVAKPIVIGSATVTARTGTTEIDFLAITKATGLQTIVESQVTNHTSGASFAFTSASVIDTKTITVAGASTTVATTNLNATTSIKVGQAPVVSVQGGNRLTTIELHYAADYDATTNKTGSAALGGVDIDAEAATSVTVMAANVTGAIDINVTPAAATAGRSVTVSFPNLLSAKGFSSDALDNSALAKLKTLGSTGLTLDYQTAVSLPALTVSEGAITLTKATSLSAPVLARVGVANSATLATVGSNITANEIEGTVSLPALVKAGNISMTKVTTFSAPLAKVNGIDIEELSGTTVVTSIELGSVSTYPAAGANPALVTSSGGAILEPATISSLKLNAQDAVMDLTAFTNATSISYTGKAVLNGLPASGTLTIDSNNSKLQTLTLGGVLGTVSVKTIASAAAAIRTNATTGVNENTALTTITTSGTIESLTVENNYDLTTINALHTDSTTSATAAVLVVKNNYNLATLKTGITTFKEITITGNYKLSNLDLSSVVSVPANFVANASTTQVALTITGNYFNAASTGTGGKVAVYGGTAATASTTAPLSTYTGMTGDFTAATSVAAKKYDQDDLDTLSTFFTSLQTKFLGTGAASADSRGIEIDLDYAWETATPAVQTFASGETEAGALTISGTSTSGGTSASIFSNLLLIE